MTERNWQRLATVTRSRDSLVPTNYQNLCQGALR